jgi:uncharacterized protein (DUF1810 family)
VSIRGFLLHEPGHDPFDLARFEEAQDPAFYTALAELQEGRKQTHWMWFIFPQLAGLGTSAMARKYAIATLDEARAYLAHPVLGLRLLQCCAAVLDVRGKSARDIMGSPDDMKLRSSMTLFARVAPPGAPFQAVLDRYYQGQPDERTLSLLGPA